MLFMASRAGRSRRSRSALQVEQRTSRESSPPPTPERWEVELWSYRTGPGPCSSSGMCPAHPVDVIQMAVTAHGDEPHGYELRTC